jgi:uncharacterized protein YhaN
MQIRTLHIDGFGRFFNRNISGFDSGLNIIYGENESGKTTLLEFIRRMLFGFKVKKAGGLKNDYPSLFGGNYGGQISCLTPEGKPFTIVRAGKPGTKDGEVSILFDSKELSGQEHLDELLGHTTGNNYKNIYAFTLDELQDFGLLGDEHVKNQIYGAGLGLGNISLANVKNYFEKRCEGIFLPKGSKPAMNILWADIKKIEQEIMDVKSQSSQFGELTEALSRRNSDQKSIESKKEKLRSKVKFLQRRRDLYPAFTGIVKAQNELKGLGEAVDFPPKGIEDFNLLKSRIKISNNSILDESKNKNGLQKQCEKIEVNKDLIEKESNVSDLLKMTDSVRSALQDKIGLEKAIISINDSIKVEIKRVEKRWDESLITKFEYPENEKSHVEDLASKLNAIEQTIQSSEDQLVSHRERKSLENSNGWEILAWCGVAVFAFVSLGIAGIFLGLIQNNISLLSFSSAVFILGCLFFWKVHKAKKQLTDMDVLESSILAKLKQAVVDRDSTVNKWKSWLIDRNFDPNLSHNELDKVIFLIDKIKGMVAERDKLNQRLSKIVETENAAIKLAAEVTRGVPDFNCDDNILNVIDQLGKCLGDAKQSSHRRSLLESKLEVANNRLTKLKEQVSDLSSKLENLFGSVGVTDEKSFLQKHATFERRHHLENSVLEKQKLIQASVGSEEAYDKFINELESTSQENLHKELEIISAQLKKIETEASNLNQSIGEVRNKLSQLVSNDDLLILQSNLEMKKEKLNNLSRDWVVSRLAISMLAKGKMEYEKNRQPSVIKSASQLFSKMTGYGKIMKPLDSDSLFIFDENEKRKSVEEMSRGTREQLYLAMRLGLIDEYESRSEPLPVIMDDVFVNFDDDRREKVIKILNEFSRDRQVIILSCHKHSLDLYTSLGANQVLIN